MVQFQKWSITEIENLMPFEREVYVIKLNQHIEDEEQKQKSLSP
jgi:hypothetical protein